MRFKRAMAASMAGVMAIGSAVVCQVTASAADVDYDSSNPFIIVDGHTTSYNFSLTKAQNINEGTDTYHFETTTGNWDGSFKEEAGGENPANLTVYFYDLGKGALTDLKVSVKVNGEEVASSMTATVDNSTWDFIARGNAAAGSRKSITIATIDSDLTLPANATVSVDVKATYVPVTISANAKVWEKNSSGKWQITSGSEGSGLDTLKVDLDTDIPYSDIESIKADLLILGGNAKGAIGINDASGSETDAWKSAEYDQNKLSPVIELDGVAENGQLEIQVWWADPNVTIILNNITVTKKPTLVSSITIADPAKTTYNIGDKVTLSASVNEDATVEDKDIVWSSDNTDVATVDETTGEVTFVGAGDVTITAAYKSDPTINKTITLKSEKIAVTATITAKDVTDATDNDTLTLEKAKAAVTVDTTLAEADYDLTVKLTDDKKGYTASVALTNEAAKKYTLTCADASGKIAYKVTGLILSADTLTIPITSEGVQLTATIQPEGLAEGEIIWNVKDNTVATYEDGMVKPVSGSAGNSTIITATVKDTDVKATCKVTIAEVLNPAADITLDKTELSGTAGEKATLKATVVGEDSTKDSTDVVTWKSSSEDVATVTAGNVTFVGAGTATITAKAGEKSATCTVTVKAATVAVDKVTLDKTTAEITVGDTTTLKATVTPDNATDKTVTWTSSNESVATVKDGVVTAVKAGTATITAKAGDKTATCTVTVKAKEETPAANEKEIWTGSTDLGTDWSKSVAVPKADVKIGDTIRIKVGTGSAEYHQIKIMDSNWEVLSSVKSKADAKYGTITVDKDGYVEFVVNAADAKLISEGGLIISGYDLTISSVSNKALKDETYAPSTKVHTVVKNGTSMIAVFAISEEDAAKYDSYTVTITRGSDNKSTYIVIDNCYKYVTYTKDNEDIRVSGDGAYYIMLDITGIESSFGGITIRIDPTVPKG